MGLGKNSQELTYDGIVRRRRFVSPVEIVVRISLSREDNPHIHEQPSVLIVLSCVEQG